MVNRAELSSKWLNKPELKSSKINIIKNYIVLIIIVIGLIIISVTHHIESLSHYMHGQSIVKTITITITKNMEIINNNNKNKQTLWLSDLPNQLMTNIPSKVQDKLVKKCSS